MPYSFQLDRVLLGEGLEPRLRNMLEPLHAKVRSAEVTEMTRRGLEALQVRLGKPPPPETAIDTAHAPGSFDGQVEALLRMLLIAGVEMERQGARFMKIELSGHIEDAGHAPGFFGLMVWPTD